MLKYRFKKADGSDYPNWKENTLISLSEFIKDGTHASFKDTVSGYPLLSAKDVNGKVLIPNDCRIISEEDYKNIYSKYSLKINDVILTIVGTIGRTALITSESLNVAFQRSVAIIRVKENVVPAFLNYVIQTSKVQNYLLRNATKSAQSGVYLNVLNDTIINYPNPEEQQKIADFLSAVDNQIDIQRQRVETMETQKKGLLDKVFSQELRFKKEDGSDFPAWEEKQLKDVSDCSTARKTDKLSSYVSTDNMIANFGGVIFDNDDEGTIRSVEYRNNDILLSNIRPYFKKLWLSDRNGVCSSDVKVFRPNNVNPAFLYYALSLDKFFSYIMKNVTGTKMPRGNVDFMKKYKFMVSISLEEQQKIADFFTAIDNQINIEKQRLTTMEMIKKGLLQQMFC